MGVLIIIMHEYHFDDPLWDGPGCIHSNCCSVPNQPWFYRQLNETTSANIEARLCNKRSFANGFTIIDQLNFTFNENFKTMYVVMYACRLSLVMLVDEC